MNLNFQSIAFTVNDSDGREIFCTRLVEHEQGCLTQTVNVIGVHSQADARIYLISELEQDSVIRVRMLQNAKAIALDIVRTHI